MLVLLCELAKEINPSGLWRLFEVCRLLRGLLVLPFLTRQSRLVSLLGESYKNIGSDSQLMLVTWN